MFSWHRMPLASSDDEIGLEKVSGLDPDHGDRISAREVNHGIPRNNIIADHGLQGVPIRKAVSLHVDDIVLRRRAADSRIAGMTPSMVGPATIVCGAMLVLCSTVRTAGMTPSMVGPATIVCGAMPMATFAAAWAI
jgi:hypothetical protein